MRRTAMPAPVGAALFLGLACHGSSKQEASSLAAAIERYQRADNASKMYEAELVTAVVCTNKRVCEAKTACVRAIVPAVRALQIKDEVAARLADIERRHVSADFPEAQALPSKLSEAEKLLNEGRSKMPECEERLTDLRIVYGP